MNTLWILTEDDSDTLLYEGCAERVTGMAFTPVCRRLRKGAGLGAVRASLKLVLSEIARMAEGSGVYFLVSTDNDRAPHAAAGEALSGGARSSLTKLEQRKPDRYADLVKALEEHFGADRTKWRTPLAVAIPVEMLESWLLLIAQGGDAAALPRFSRSDSSLAREYHRSALPPPQLKDLLDEICKTEGFPNRAECALELVTKRLDPKDLAARSPSFALFKHWLDDWSRKVTSE